MSDRLDPEALAEAGERITDARREDGKCWACGKINCTCDEETMQAMDEADRAEEEYIEREELSSGIYGTDNDW